MITNLKLPFDMNKNLLATSQEHRKSAPVVGESLKIYIPLLMINIDKYTGISNDIITSNNYQSFLNDRNCRPKTQNIIKRQNYMTARLENNTNWITDNDINKDNSKWMNIVKNVKKIISETDNIRYMYPITTNITVGDDTLSLRTDCSGFIITCLQLYTGLEYNFVCSELTNTNGIMKTKYNFIYIPFTSLSQCKTGDIIGNSQHAEIFSRIGNDGNVYVYRVANDESFTMNGEEITNNNAYTYIWRPPYDQNCINIGDKLECHAINGRLDKLCYNNNIYL